MTYELVLKEKEGTCGLTKDDVNELFDKIIGTEAFPIDLEARTHECAAMGFITTEAADKLDYDYEKSGLHDFIAAILDDMDNESETCEYEFKGLKIYLSR